MTIWTGLHNRRALLQHLDQRLALPGQPGPVALFLDLDRLAPSTTTWATPVTSSFTCSPNGSVTHFGESLIARSPAATNSSSYPHSNECRCRSTARRTSRESQPQGTTSLSAVRCSPGHRQTVSPQGLPDSTPSDLLRRAGPGRSGSQTRFKEMSRFSPRTCRIAGELRNDIELHRRGIESDALSPSLPTRGSTYRPATLSGTEALVWQHPTCGLPAPGRFIPVAESINLCMNWIGCGAKEDLQ